MTQIPLHVGVDVAKAHLDVALGAEGEFFQVGNDETGWGELIARECPIIRVSSAVGH